ncbi:MAG: hypothetical protein ACOX1M_05725 [Erysipelotrichaceae bacterium]
MKKLLILLVAVILLISVFGCRSDEDKAQKYFEEGDYHNAYVLYNQLENKEKSDEVVLKWVKELVKPENLAGDENFKDIKIYSNEVYNKVFKTILDNMKGFSWLSPTVDQFARIFNGFSSDILKEEEIKVKEALNADKTKESILYTATEEDYLKRDAGDDYFLENHKYTFSYDVNENHSYEGIMNADRINTGGVILEKYGIVLIAETVNGDEYDWLYQYVCFVDTSGYHLLNNGNLGDKFGFLYLKNEIIYQMSYDGATTLVYKFDQKPEKIEKIEGFLAENFVLFLIMVENDYYTIYRINMNTNNAVKHVTELPDDNEFYVVFHRPLNSNVLVYHCVNQKFIEKFEDLSENRELVYSLFNKYGYEMCENLIGLIDDLFDENFYQEYSEDLIKIIEKEYGIKYIKEYTYLIRENKLSSKEIWYDDYFLNYQW